ncbi:D-alanyl-D-alanine carboxypeptidase/D-alanyl-D-alanine-endopeptidase [Kitasatospora sp. NPDC127111]|uniref:D-alanyl-D-alanine carboxypeptidase/D-alanyl-D-alanine endopeptidase n=1 Tax=Kitasatospora sp. NPDC127111 TaxID=3345363 RepID=UPI003631137A
MRPLPARRWCVPLVTLLTALFVAGPAPSRPHAEARADAWAATRSDTRSGADPAGAELAADLDRLLADRRLAGAQVSVEVTDAATGEVVYQHAPDALLLPASTLKTVTAAAALELLGPDHRFATEVLAAGPRVGGRLDGDLVLRGGGDPSLLPADLDELAHRVAAAGVTEVTGAVRADATRWDDVRLGPNWAWDDQPYYYSPQISALTLTTDTDYDPGTVRLTVTPGGEPGRPAAVRLTPADAPVRLTGRIDTAPAGGAPAVDVTRRLGGNEIVLAGSVPAGAAPTEEWVTVDDPAAVAASVFAAALARHGVTVGGGVAAGRAAPADAAPLARHESATVGELTVPFLKLSNNGIAEHLVKEIGLVRAGSGSWTAGLAEVAAFVHRNGLDTTVARQSDGSGLSRHNLMTARRFAALLEFARGRPWFRVWYDALPVAGDPRRMVGGTLAHRLAGTAAEGRVHAKTGSMTGVDTLTGYVEGGARTLAFTVLCNNFADGSPRPVIDALVVRLAGGPAVPPGPAPAHPAVRTGGKSDLDWT